jgi:hypothetical protein
MKDVVKTTKVVVDKMTKATRIQYEPRIALMDARIMRIKSALVYK